MKFYKKNKNFSYIQRYKHLNTIDMELLNNQSLLIEKEDISNFVFPKEDVLLDKLDINNRTESIQKGMKLGNAFKNKVQIYFEDSISIRRVDTTIWGSTEKYLILKGNMLIPVRRIHRIDF